VALVINVFGDLLGQMYGKAVREDERKGYE
jgi:hypothetical protein